MKFTFILCTLLAMVTHTAFHPCRTFGVVALIVAAIVGLCGQYDFALTLATSGAYAVAACIVLLVINTAAFRAAKAQL